MSKNIKYTLLSDGSSDKALMFVIDWALSQTYTDIQIIKRAWADFSSLSNPPALHQLDKRMAAAITKEPCDILFVHRDCEKQTLEQRLAEINSAWAKIEKNYDGEIQLVAVVPVRMTEAWLLIDITAIRKAAGNPHGKMDIKLPDVKKLEQLPDPKKNLQEILSEAKGLNKRRMKNFNVNEAIQLVAANIEDFSQLRKLASFQKFEQDLQRALEKIFPGN